MTGETPPQSLISRRDQPRIDPRRQVGRGLDIHLKPQDETRGGDGPKEVVEIGLRGLGELGAGLGAEVLDDDFLYVPELPMQIADGDERLEPLGPRLPDADQNAGGERNTQFARQPQRLEARLGRLVGRAVMNAARFAKPCAQRFQHDSLAGRDCAQPGDLGAAHDSGIGVRQEAGLAHDERAHRVKIIDRGFMPERVQRLARGAIA